MLTRSAFGGLGSYFIKVKANLVRDIVLQIGRQIRYCGFLYLNQVNETTCHNF